MNTGKEREENLDKTYKHFEDDVEDVIVAGIHKMRSEGATWEEVNDMLHDGVADALSMALRRAVVEEKRAGVPNGPSDGHFSAADRPGQGGVNNG